MASTLTSAALYPSPSDAALKLEYVGKSFGDIQAPQVILDRAVARRNCRLMLDTVEKLGLGFRAHVKTHKTTQLARMQVGEDSRDIKLVASTVAEIEHMAPWLYECRQQGKSVNVLYGLPLSLSSIPRLAHVARVLGPGSVGLFVDHPAHVDLIKEVPQSTWPGQIPVWVNIDVGYHREGVGAQSKQLADLARALASTSRARVAGVYTHYGHSYAVSSPEEALENLSAEVEGLREGAESFLQSAGKLPYPLSKVTLSLGATPTATAAQNILHHDIDATRKYKDLLTSIGSKFDVELHAGVYPLMDMQQLATRARPERSATHANKSLLTFDDIGLRTMVEVISLYPDREEKPGAMIAGGCIVLGREPCKSYPGWGVLTPWPAKGGQTYDPAGERTGWIVAKVSQEHGNLSWEGPTEKMRELAIGEKVLVWPNHACIAGVAFGWYLVVDSDTEEPDKVVDVWTRWRGW